VPYCVVMYSVGMPLLNGGCSRPYTTPLPSRASTLGGKGEAGNGSHGKKSGWQTGSFALVNSAKGPQGVGKVVHVGGGVGKTSAKCPVLVPNRFKGKFSTTVCQKSRESADIFTQKEKGEI